MRRNDLSVPVVDEKFTTKDTHLQVENKHRFRTRKHSSRMHTNRTVTKMRSERVAMRLIVDRMTDAYENITFPCGR